MFFYEAGDRVSRSRHKCTGKAMKMGGATYTRPVLHVPWVGLPNWQGTGMRV